MTAEQGPRRAAPTGLNRILLALGCAIVGVVAGAAGGLLVIVVGYGLGAGLGSLVLGYGFGLLVAAVWVAWLYHRNGLGAGFGLIALVIAVAGMTASVGGSAVTTAIALVSPVVLGLIAFLTDPGRPVHRRPGRLIALAGALAAVVLVAIPLVVSDLRNWRHDTAALERLGDPPLVPTAPGLVVQEVRAFHSRRSSELRYEVADADGTAFATVRQEQVGSRPMVSDDCFSILLDGPPMVGCLEVVPGVYRAEYRNDRSDASYFVPREHSVIAIRELVSGANIPEYGEDGAGDEQLERIATSLRPAPVQDLARRNCRLCRLMPR